MSCPLMASIETDGHLSEVHDVGSDLDVVIEPGDREMLAWRDDEQLRVDWRGRNLSAVLKSHSDTAENKSIVRDPLGDTRKGEDPISGKHVAMIAVIKQIVCRYRGLTQRLQD